MTLMADLIRQHDIRPDQVRRVRVGTNRNMPNALIHHRPTDELQAKFSMEFCLAILLVERKGGLAQFTTRVPVGATGPSRREVVNRPDVQAMIEKVEFGVHPDAEAAGYDKMTTIIDVDLADGRTISGRADFGKGSPQHPMSDDELVAKFLDCAAWGGLSPDRAQEVAERVLRLEREPDIRRFTALLAG
jgi:2-methylcitrate dehydratase PrpD